MNMHKILDLRKVFYNLKLESFQIVQFIGSKIILYSGNNLTTVTKILRQLFEIQFIKTSTYISIVA